MTDRAVARRPRARCAMSGSCVWLVYASAAIGAGACLPLQATINGILAEHMRSAIIAAAVSVTLSGIYLLLCFAVCAGEERLRACAVHASRMPFSVTYDIARGFIHPLRTFGQLYVRGRLRAGILRAMHLGGCTAASRESRPCLLVGHARRILAFAHMRVLEREI